VNSSQGGGSKDTWVLAAADHGREVSPASVVPASLNGTSAASRAAKAPMIGPLPEQDAQQQQQQQQQSGNEGGVPC